MNVSLTPQLEELVNRKVASGLYNSASEVVREGLRLLDEQDAIRRLRIAELRKKIASGIRQAERGEVIESDALIKRLRARNGQFRRKPK